MYLWFIAFVATSTAHVMTAVFCCCHRQVELRQKEGHPSVRVFDRAVEDAQGRKTVGGLGWERKIWGDVVTFHGMSKSMKVYLGPGK